MTGQMKNYNLNSNKKIVEQYFNDFNPYESRTSIGIDLLALTRYAKAHNIKLEDMNDAEVAKFKKNIKEV